MDTGGNPVVFMDLAIQSRPPKRIEIELFSDLVPKAAENFRALCTGEKGIGKTTGKPLHYKGSMFSSIYPELGAEGGDFENNDGSGGESIFGGTFLAESNPMGRSAPGMLMTVNQAPHATGSLFLICFRHSVFLEGHNTVFGRVINGMETVLQLERLGRYASVNITDCGQVSVTDSDDYQSRLDEELRLSLWWNNHMSETRRSDAVISTLKPVAEEVTNKLFVTREVTSETPPTNSPEQISKLNADISEMKRVAEELTNNRLSTSVKPSSDPDQMSEASRSDAVISTLKPVAEEVMNKSLVTREVTSETPPPSSPEQISELKRVAEEFMNDWLVTYKRRHQHSDGTSKSRRGVRIRGGRVKGVRIPSLRNGSTKSGSPEDENNNGTESSKELKIKKRRFQHDLIMSIVELRESIVELRESNAEKKVADKMRTNLKVNWPMIAVFAGAMILAGVVCCRHP